MDVTLYTKYIVERVRDGQQTQSPYNPDYVYGTEEMRMVYFTIHPVSSEQIKAAEQELDRKHSVALERLNELKAEAGKVE